MFHARRPDVTAGAHPHYLGASVLPVPRSHGAARAAAVEFTQRRDELARRGLQAPLRFLELGSELLIARTLVPATHLCRGSALSGLTLSIPRARRRIQQRGQSWTGTKSWKIGYAEEKPILTLGHLKGPLLLTPPFPTRSIHQPPDVAEHHGAWRKPSSPRRADRPLRFASHARGLHSGIRVVRYLIKTRLFPPQQRPFVAASRCPRLNYDPTRP